MLRPSAFPATSLETASHPAADTRLQGGWLLLAWVGWSTLTLLSLTDFISSIHEYLVDVLVPCLPGSCVSGQPTPETAQVLHQLGFSVDAYTALGVGLVIAAGLVSCMVAIVIIWRKPTDWMALLATSTLITQGLFENNYLQGIFDNPASPWHVVGLVLSYLSPVQVLFLCAFFPNGRSVPRWMGLLLVGICLIDLPPSLFPSLPFGDLIEALFVFSGFPLIVGSMIYRYRRVSTLMERQQTKWAVFGITLSMLAFMAWFVPQIILFSSLSQPGSVYDLIGHPLLVISFLSIPFCIGIAILRYRLWDIDVIINKVLVYGSLTVLVALVYIGLIIGLQSLVRQVTGQISQSPVVIVASTLAIAAFFQPLRHRIQDMIDHRFYRRKYDAKRIVANFGTTLRDEVDLSQLSEHLLAVVQETMQPAHVSLWMRPPAHDRTHQAPLRSTFPISSDEK